MFVWGVAPPGSQMSTGSGEGCHYLGLVEGSSAGRGGATRAGDDSEEEAPCEGLSGRDIGDCPINTWKEATSMLQSSAGLVHRAV